MSVGKNARSGLHTSDPAARLAIASLDSGHPRHGHQPRFVRPYRQPTHPAMNTGSTPYSVPRVSVSAAPREATFSEAVRSDLQVPT